MRKFYLKNSNGDLMDLNIIEHFLENPQGLGTAHKESYEHVGNYFMLINDEIKQKTIEGKIYLPDYEAYRNFARFVEQGPMVLTYTTDVPYYIDLKLASITKTEKETGGLFCKVKFTCLSLWYRSYESRKDNSEALGKTYNYTYDYQYTNSRASTLELDIDSIIECPYKLTIIGPAVNPLWTIEKDGSVIGTGKVNKTIPEGKRLVIDTTSVPYTIKEMSNNGSDAEDAYQYSDFSTQRFIPLEKGHITVRISHVGADDLNFILERRELYETV